MLIRWAVLSLCLLTFAAPARPADAAQLAIAWTDTASDEDGFLVERRAATSGSFQQIVALGPNAIAYVDSAVAPGMAVCYRVRAFNIVGMSAYTNEVCGTAPEAPLLPLSVTLNRSTFRPSDTMVATVQAVGGLVSGPVDAYVVVQAGGALLSLQLDGRLVPGLVPLARNVALPTVSAPFAFPLAGAPPGTYTWLAGVTTPGTLSLVAPIASTSFTVTP